MQHYSFALALRFWHPSIEPAAITDQLGFEPSRSWQAGGDRFTPNGTPLDDVHGESYWHSEPLASGWRDSTDTNAQDAVLQLLEHLAPHATFLHVLPTTGGRGLIHVGSYGCGNYALVFPPELLSQCANLGLSLAHDVYSVPQA
jgi:hypothetical protein